MAALQGAWVGRYPVAHLLASRMRVWRDLRRSMQTRETFPFLSCSSFAYYVFGSDASGDRNTFDVSSKESPGMPDQSMRRKEPGIGVWRIPSITEQLHIEAHGGVDPLSPSLYLKWVNSSTKINRLGGIGPAGTLLQRWAKKSLWLLNGQAIARCCVPKVSAFQLNASSNVVQMVLPSQSLRVMVDRSTCHVLI
jgi:hypothetical protein